MDLRTDPTSQWFQDLRRSLIEPCLKPGEVVEGPGCDSFGAVRVDDIVGREDKEVARVTDHLMKR